MSFLQNGKVEVQCPHCGSFQREPARVISTYCRTCGRYFSLRQPEKPATAAVGDRLRALLLPALRSPRFREILRAAKLLPLLPRVAFAEDGNSAEEDAALQKREVVCFECGVSQLVSRRAGSTQCRACSTFIDLRDWDVRTPHTGRIRTRGDVRVHKKGALLGTAVYCGSLILHGKVNGSVQAQETVEIQTDCNIIGQIRCRRFVVGRKCVVRCHQPVYTEELEVHGWLSGRIFVTGKSVIEGRATLEGTLITGALHLRPGGTLNGDVEVKGMPSAGTGGGRL